MQVIDITGVIEEGMWHYEAPIEPPTIEEISSLDGPLGWQAFKISLTTITGTYLEASSHVRKDGETIDRIDVGRLIVPATLIHLREVSPRASITADDFIFAEMIPHKGDAILFSTGWERMWNNPNFIRDSPHLTFDAAEWLLNSGAPIIGSDLPAFDNPVKHIGIIEKLFSKDVLLLGPLINIRQAEPSRFLLAAFPLKIKGVCGTPCRVMLVNDIHRQFHLFEQSSKL